MTANKKALLKTLSWRAVASTDTLVISYLITGSLEIASAILSVEIVSKMVLYYLHEKIWMKKGKVDG